MDKITKFLLKLSPKEQGNLLSIIENILEGNIDNLDCKKLKNQENLFRIRKGNIRIIFKKSGDKGVITAIDYRGNIYKNT